MGLFDLTTWNPGATYLTPEQQKSASTMGWLNAAAALANASAPHPLSQGPQATTLQLLTGGAQAFGQGANQYQDLLTKAYDTQSKYLDLQAKQALQPLLTQGISNVTSPSGGVVGQVPSTGVQQNTQTSGYSRPLSVADQQGLQMLQWAMMSRNPEQVSKAYQSLYEHNPELAGAVTRSQQLNTFQKTPEGTYVMPIVQQEQQQQTGNPLTPFFQQPTTNPMLPNLVNAESGGNPQALSPKGAAGIAQIMPSTATNPGYGVKPLQNWDGKDPRTAPVDEQLRFSNDYLNAMQKAGGGDPRMGAAGYNAGPGAMLAALTATGGNPSDAVKQLPPETQSYVDKVANTATDGKLYISSAQVYKPDPTETPKYNTANTETGVNQTKVRQAHDIEGDQKISDSIVNANQMMSRVDDMIEAYKSGKAGTLIAQDPDLAQKLIATGIITDKGVINDVAQFQRATANQAVEVINQVKAALAGSSQSRILASEIQSLQDKLADPKQQPQAIHDILGLAKGVAQYNYDMAGGWKEIGGLGNRAASGYTMSPSSYVLNFNKEHNIMDYAAKAKQDMGQLAGMQPTVERINIMTPDGKRGTIDKSHLDDLLRAGGKVLQ